MRPRNRARAWARCIQRRIWQFRQPSPVRRYGRLACRDRWSRSLRPPVLLDAFIRLRLRRPACRLLERTDDPAPRQLDLEVIVAEAARIAQDDVGRAEEALPRCRCSVELRFGATVAPWLMRDSAKCEPCLADRSAFDVEANRNRYEGER